ncbi:ParB N-terminal domain-containing protein [Streptomyces nymphaeiformis]|uniref:ParB/Sulfiredoxin domain-containing protein n=1 Tax=Streptomyces nymphaeiformis TaxID=2663842 RepID=A0A7W7U4R1_9ACTN|nr:ParB N-terminal domain-containing protein [Streptomyces nymphaeiformis]MBB4985000.1 hypothetical protein [Streptomyces nymphaeiformis]
MALYTGTLPTRLLNDQQIRPSEYRKWKHAADRFERRDKDRKVLDGLKVSIPADGLLEPILLGVDDRYHDVRVSDGHHRAVALMQLGVAEFRFRWCWIRAYRVEHARDPFPYHLLGL